MSEYFDSTQNRVVQGSLAKASHVNDVRDEVGVGFDKLADPDNINNASTTYSVDSGVANAYVVTLPKTTTAYVAGRQIVMYVSNTNTGASTLDVDTLGVKAIKRPDGTDLVAGDLTAGQVVELRYDGTNFRFTGATPQSVLDDITAKHDTVVAKEALVNPHYIAIDGVYANEVNINAVHANKTNIDTVADNDANVTKVADIDGDVTIVAGIQEDVTKVANIDSDVSDVAAIDTNVSTVAGAIANVNTVGADLLEPESEIDTVATNIVNINEVASINEDVSKVAAIDADVSAVAAVDAEVVTVATNMVNLTTFTDIYQGAVASDPLTRNDGSALQEGDLYFNTLFDEMRVYLGLAWAATYLPSDVYLTSLSDDSTPTLGGDLDCDSHTISGSSYKQIADVSTSGAYSFDFALGDRQQVTATADLTLSFSNFITGNVCTVIIDAVNWGAFNITHPVALQFAAGESPAYTAAGTDRLIIEKDKDDVYSMFTQLDVKAV